MGKPTGFLEFKRELPTDRSPLGRVADYKEFHEHMPEADLKKQGARCMDCGIPFWNQVVNRTAAGHAADEMAGVAEGNAAIHAARALLLEVGLGHVLVKFQVVRNSPERRPVFRQLTFEL